MYKLLRPLLFVQDSEKVHNRVAGLGQFIGQSGLQGLLKVVYDFQDPSLETNFLGIHFKNPVGLAAGFDKHAKLLNLLPAVGFGFTEIGSVTALAKDGNPKPRLFRLPQDEALINRMGLNNMGVDAMLEKLKGKKFGLPVGINITKTHDPSILGDKGIEDFIYSFKKLYFLGDYFVFNISCPNTAEGKTFEEKEPLMALLLEAKKLRPTLGPNKPVLVKISSDVSLEKLQDILQIGESNGMDGYIIGNTSGGRANISTSAEAVEKIGKGGLSGKPIRQKSTELIAAVYKILKRPCIIGLGGIDSAEAAYEKIKAGASLVQLYTGLIYQGPGVVKKINRGLVKLLKQDGFKNISEAVGKDVM